jgi:hypothetical protein
MTTCGRYVAKIESGYAKIRRCGEDITSERPSARSPEALKRQRSALTKVAGDCLDRRVNKVD